MPVTRIAACLLAFGLAVPGCVVPAAAKSKFGFETVSALAAKLAASAYREPVASPPPAIRKLDQDAWKSITFRPEADLWGKEQLPFTLEFFAQGWRFDEPVTLHAVDPRGVHAIAFDPGWFDFSASGVDPAALGGEGLAGFRARYALNLPAYRDEILSFLGASYFRMLGKGQVYGLSARGLAIDTGLASGEEFPRFTEFWIERPRRNATDLVVYALLDSPRATGAYQFTISPGLTTATDVRARLFLRAAVGTLGIAPLTSMYFHGPDQPSRGEDYRPEVHDSDGLSVEDGDGSWIWRPLANPDKLLVTSFSAKSPGGFGLMQRQRRFSAYQDLAAHYEARPSAFVQPIGDWGAGRIQLVEIPSPNETNDNIVAFWVPAAQPAPLQPFDLRYRILWQKDSVVTPPTAWVTATRRGKGYSPQPDDSIGFVVDFKGPMLADPLSDPPVTASVSAGDNGRITDRASVPNLVDGGWRIRLHVARIDATRPVELRARLHRGNRDSETWSYILPPH